MSQTSSVSNSIPAVPRTVRLNVLRVTDPSSTTPLTRPPLPPMNMPASSLSLKLLSEMYGVSKTPPAVLRMLVRCPGCSSACYR